MKMRRLIIIGAGGHGLVVADIARKIKRYKEIVFLDDKSLVQKGYKVIGKSCDFVKYVDKYDFFVAIGNNSTRERIFKKLNEAGANIISLIHPNATIAEDVQLGKGSVVMAGAVINPNVTVGEGVIVNTCSSIDHDCVINDFSHISVGARIAGTVKVGTSVFVGAGAVLVNNITVCNETVIGAGAVVIDNIDHKGTYVGVPAKLKGRV